MPDLTTTYLGLPLRNPLIVSSSGLTKTMAGIERCFRNGAGAVVLKSLFEEQIDFETRGQRETYEVSIHPEATDYLAQMGKELGPFDYLALIKEAKRHFSEPIIASVNCVSSRWWADWARQIEDAGADAIELNIAIMPRGREQSGTDVETRFRKVVEGVTRKVTIPVAVKLGPYFTALPHFLAQIHRSGVRGFVLFNRFYQLDIDVESMRLISGHQFSAQSEINQTIRWTSILCGQPNCDIAASTGVENAADVIKLLLAGACAVQICSTLYRNGYEHITTLLDGVTAWMDQKGFNSLDQFRGKLSQEESERPASYERLQYIQALNEQR